MTGLVKKLNIKEQKIGLLVRLPEELADLPKRWLKRVIFNGHIRLMIRQILCCVLFRKKKK